MGRKKVSLQFILNIMKRKATFKKRMKGLLKKAHELSTLCDVEVCLIVYGPDETVPVVWPSTLEVDHILRILKEMPRIDQSRNMMNQEAFTKSLIRKLENQARKMDTDNAEMEMQILMNDYLAGRRSLESVVVGVKELMCLMSMVEMKLNEVNREMARRNGNLVDGRLSDCINNGNLTNINSSVDNLRFNTVNATNGHSGNPLYNILNPIIGNNNPNVDAFSYFSMN